MGEKSKIKFEIQESVGFVLLADEPENRMDTRFFRELYELTRKTIPAAGIDAVVLTGEGRHFSSGADLEELQAMILENPGCYDSLIFNYEPFHFFDQINIPVVMAIKGVCLGAGLELALHGHFRLCAGGALLGLPESTFNLMPGAGGIEKMVRLAGKAKAMELILRGNSFTAAEALEAGVVDAVYPKKILLQKAVELAKLAATDYRKYKKKEYLEKIGQEKI